MKKGMVLIRRWYATGPMLIALTAALVPGSFFAEPEASIPSETPAAIIRRWPSSSRGLAGTLVAKYGVPDLSGETAMVWYDNGGWKRTVAYRDAEPREEGARDAFHLKQSILYRIPEDKIAALRQFDRRITIDKELRMMSTQSESEAENYLCLNLAHEIVVGKRSVEDARQFRRRARMLSEAGMSVPSLSGFVFTLEKDQGG